MKREFNHFQEDISSAAEQSVPVDGNSVPHQEIAPPAAEFAPCASEFYDAPERQGSQTDHARTAKSKKPPKRHVTNLMSYLVAGVLAVTMLSGTLSSGSTISDFVEALGGNTKGILRFSIQWNDGAFDGNDLDAHCIEPGGYEIFYNNANIESPGGGTLDVDIIAPYEGTPAAENIVYPGQMALPDGYYIFRVHCFCFNGGTGGFRSEIAIRGRVYRFDYNKPLEDNEIVNVAVIQVRNGRISIAERWPDSIEEYYQ